MVLRLRVFPPDKWVNAKCLGSPPENEDDDPFFVAEQMPEAIEFCNGTKDDVECPIRHECLLFALTNNQKEGIWGGMSELSRKALRKRWPLRGKEPRPEWKWHSEEDALAGLKIEDLIEDDDDDEG